MKTIGFPGCCTGAILNYLEPSLTVGPESSYFGEQLGATTAENILKFLKSKKQTGYAFVAVTTNDTQTKANALLEQLGFQSSDWMSKTAHPTTKVKLWWFQLDKLGS